LCNPGWSGENCTVRKYYVFLIEVLGVVKIVSISCNYLLLTPQPFADQMGPALTMDIVITKPLPVSVVSTCCTICCTDR
jgi:hypothetical protein